MYLDYFYWQFIAAPAWIVRLTITLERALLLFFSVTLMIRTLVAYWHRDRVNIRRGTISGMAIAFAWNLISRGIGFIIRTATLLVWLVVALAAAGAGLVTLVLFYAWPFLVILGLASGIALLLAV